jgi:hypothetical protein
MMQNLQVESPSNRLSDTYETQINTVWAECAIVEMLNLLVHHVTSRL